jgi:O-antigen/teichoic acid export membrane protein
MLGLIVSVLLAGYGVREVLLAYVTSAFLGTLVFSYFSLKVIRSNMWNVRREGKISLLRNRFREIGWFLFHTNVSAFWGMFIRQFDVLILGHFRSATEVAYFRMAKNFVQFVGRIHDPLYNSIFPEITKLWALGDVRNFNRFLESLTIITGSIFLPIALGMFFLCGVVVNSTVGSEFAPSVLAIQIMVWGMGVGCVFTWVRPTIIAIGKPVVGNVAGMICAVFFIIFSLFIVFLFGYIGSAIAFLIPYILGHIIVIGYYFRYLSRKKYER